MVQDTLDKIASEFADKSKLYNVGALAVDIIRDHLYRGDGFEPLSPATKAYRGEGRPLQDTGDLRDSIGFDAVSADTVCVGTTKPYAAIQNNGGTITAKKNWLWIPAAGTRQLQRRYGYSPSDVCKGLKKDGHSIFRIGRTVCYRSGKGKNAKNKLIFYLKKSVEIPKREFFYISDKEAALLLQEVIPNDFI